MTDRQETREERYNMQGGRQPETSNVVFFNHLFFRLGNWIDGRTDGQKEKTRQDQIYINSRGSASSWLWAVIMIDPVISNFLETLYTLLSHFRW